MPQDLSTAQPTCAAAKGISGVPLICTDFPSAQTLVDLKGMGWDFTYSCSGGVGWTVLNAALQVSNYATFVGSCYFHTRPLTADEYQKYNSFTLSVVQTADLNALKQYAWIYLGIDDYSRQLSFTTGPNPRQRTMYEVAKTALPNGGSSSYQPVFKFSSAVTAGMSNMGWQIESIAVMGNP